jgi:hypothetical protein
MMAIDDCGRLFAGVDVDDSEWVSKIYALGAELTALRARFGVERIMPIVVEGKLYIGIDVVFLEDGRYSGFLTCCKVGIDDIDRFCADGDREENGETGGTNDNRP